MISMNQLNQKQISDLRRGAIALLSIFTFGTLLVNYLHRMDQTSLSVLLAGFLILAFVNVISWRKRTK